MIAAADQSTGIMWAIPAYQRTAVPGGTGTDLFTGSANTDRIIAQNGAGSTYAAGLARAYSGGGYSDWYLPSKDELDKLFFNKDAIGGFVAGNFYWSSSEYYTSPAYSSGVEGFDNGHQCGEGKISEYYVRAVRSS